jgi:hypothetical protein
VLRAGISLSINTTGLCLLVAYLIESLASDLW